MTQRNPIVVFILSLVTCGIYQIYWYVVTKGELVAKGAEIPTAILIIIPLVNIWWMWRYSMGVEKVTKEQVSGILAFLLLVLLGPIGAAVVQNGLNKVS